MSQFYHKTSFIIAAVLSMAACQRQEMDHTVQEGTTAHGQDVTEYRIGGVSSWEQGVQTKANTITAETTVSEFEYSIFDSQSGRFIAYGTNTTPMTKLNRNGKYDFYIWSRMNNEDDISDEVTYTSRAALNSASYLFTASQTNWNNLSYVPISGCLKDVTPNEIAGTATAINIPMEYLMAKVNLTVSYDALLKEMFQSSLGGSVTISSVSVGGMSKRVGIFDSSYNQTYTGSGNITQEDAVSPASLEGGSYTIFIPENLSGDLLPDNTDPAKKTPESLSAEGYSPAAYPYIEVVVDYASILFDSQVKYRFYLGENATTNFDVRRNKVYDISLQIDYNSTNSTFPGNWKIDANPTFTDELTFAAYPEIAYAGQIITLQHTYKTKDIDRTSLYGQPGGYAIGQAADMESYLDSGTLPTGYNVISSNFDMIKCNTCGSYYHAVPRVTYTNGRKAWLDANLIQDPANVYKCKWCETTLFDYSGTTTPGNNPAYIFRMVPTSGGTGKIPPVSDAYVSLVPYESNWVTYTIPSDAKAGSTYRFQLWTRDGRLIKAQDVTIGTGVGQPTVRRIKKGNLYLAQRDTVEVISYPSSYGSDPDFEFSSSNTSIFEVTKIDKRKAVVAASKPTTGTANVQVRMSGSVVAEIEMTTAAPKLYTRRANNLSVSNGGGSISVAPPAYYKTDSEPYIDYEEDLYESVLGTPELSSTTKYGFVGTSNHTSYGNAVHEIWLDKIETSSRFMGFGAAIDEITWVSGKSSAVGTFSEPVAFENGVLDGILSKGMSPRVSRMDYIIGYNSATATTPYRRYENNAFSVPAAINVPQLQLLSTNKSIKEYRQGPGAKSTDSRSDIEKINTVSASEGKYSLNTSLALINDKGYYINYYYVLKPKTGEPLDINFFRLDVYAHYQAKYMVTEDDRPGDLYMRGHLEHRASGVDYWYDINESRWSLYHVNVSIWPEVARPTFKSLFQMDPRAEGESGYTVFPKRHDLKDDPNAPLYIESTPFWATGTCYYYFGRSIEANCNYLAVRNSRYRKAENGYYAVIDRMWYRPLSQDDINFLLTIGLTPTFFGNIAAIGYAIDAKAGTLIHTKYNKDVFMNDNKPVFVPSNPNSQWTTDTYYTDRIATRNINDMQVYSLPNYWDTF